MAFLQKMVRGKPKGTIKLWQGTIRIGRGEGTDVRLTAPGASKLHAAIECSETLCEVSDLGSRNGTFVNGIPIKSCTVLRHCDVLEFAGTTFVFLESEDEPSDDSLSDSNHLNSNPLKVLTPLPDDTDPEQSLRRAIVRTGDVVSPADLVEYPGVVGPRVTASLDMHDLPMGTWSAADANRKLSHVLRLVRAITSINEPREFDNVLRLLLDLFSPASHSLIAIHEGTTNGFQIIAAVCRDENDDVFLCHPLMRRSIDDLEGLLVTDHWRNDPKEKPKMSDLSRQSLLCVPIPGPERTCLGVIQMQANDPRRPFTEPDLQRLAVLSHVLGAALPGFRRLA